MKKLNNKGAALLSVMIAITFISIVATTLLVITLNNYQMKVVNSQSKSNFYETEQRINVVTAQVRNSIPGSTDVNASVGTLLNGGTGVNYNDPSGFGYTAEKIAELAFPGETVETSSSDVTVTSDGDKFYFYPGTVTVTAKPAGKQITLNDVTIKQVSSDSKGGYENTIKTDINFFVKIDSGSASSGGVGSCSFLLDNNIRIDASDKLSRVNIGGNCIMGDYTYYDSGSYYTDYQGGELASPVELTEYSLPVSLDKTYVDDDTVESVTLSDSNYQKAIIYLNNLSQMNFNSDNNVILGDIYIKDGSVLNVISGNFTVYGDIFVADRAAFLCNGNLKLGYNHHIYKVYDDGSCDKVLASDKSKNIVLGSISNLDKKNFDKMAEFLNLFDDKDDNDGILPKIIDPAGAHDKYFYETTNAFQTKTDALCKFNGNTYYAEYPPANFNGGRANELIFITNDLETDGNGNKTVRITQHIPNCTIFSMLPVYAYDTHNICVSCVGDQAFNYIRNNSDCKINFNSSSGSEQIVIGDFFNDSCDSYVMTVFNISTGSTGSTPVPSMTKTSYTDWIKE